MQSQLLEFTKKTLFKTANEFSLFIETEAAMKEDTCYSTIIDFCAENDVEYESITSLINRQLKDKLEVEFAEIGMLKRKSTLF